MEKLVGKNVFAIEFTIKDGLSIGDSFIGSSSNILKDVPCKALIWESCQGKSDDQFYRLMFDRNKFILQFGNLLDGLFNCERT